MQGRAPAADGAPRLAQSWLALARGALTSSSHQAPPFSKEDTEAQRGLLMCHRLGQGRASPGKQGPEPRPSSYTAAAMGTERTTCVASGLASGSLERAQGPGDIGAPQEPLSRRRTAGKARASGPSPGECRQLVLLHGALGTGPVGDSGAHGRSPGQMPHSPQSQEPRPTGPCQLVAGNRERKEPQGQTEPSTPPAHGGKRPRGEHIHQPLGRKQEPAKAPASRRQSATEGARWSRPA